MAIANGQHLHRPLTAATRRLLRQQTIKGRVRSWQLANVPVADLYCCVILGAQEVLQNVHREKIRLGATGLNE